MIFLPIGSITESNDHRVLPVCVERVDHAAVEQRRRGEVDGPVCDLRLDVDPEAAGELAAALLQRLGTSVALRQTSLPVLASSAKANLAVAP